MLAVLILAYALERGLHELQVIASRTFNAAPFVWAAALADLLLAGALLTLAWFTLRKDERSRWVALVFVLVGLLLKQLKTVAEIVQSLLFKIVPSRLQLGHMVGEVLHQRIASGDLFRDRVHQLF